MKPWLSFYCGAVYLLVPHVFLIGLLLVTLTLVIICLKSTGTRVFDKDRKKDARFSA